MPVPYPHVLAVRAVAVAVAVTFDMAGLLPLEEMSSEGWRKWEGRRMDTSVPAPALVLSRRLTQAEKAARRAPMALVGGDGCDGVIGGRWGEDEKVS